jgi:hypothetical protein
MLSLSAIPQRLGASPPVDVEKSDRPATPSGAMHSSYFFKHPTFEYVFLVSLGRAYQMAGNVGKVLYLSKQIEDGYFESAYQNFKQAGDEARAIAEESASQGHKESGWQAYLWAQNFYDSSTYSSRFLPTWELLCDCWLKALSLFEPPIEPIRIPYENTELHGFFFKGTSTSRERPLLILNNGSDGSLLDMWT